MLSRAVRVTMIVTILSGCGSASAPGTPSPTSAATPAVGLASRPSSPAKIWFIAPTSASETISGSVLHIDVGISGAQLTTSTSTHITPTLGHIHLYTNGVLNYMNYKPTLDLPVHPGFTYEIHAEFVATDHFPFNPRIVTPTIYVHVTG